MRPTRFALTAWLALGLVAAGLATTAARAATTTYTITDLGSLGYGVTDGYAINNNGQVTGRSYTAAAIQISCPPRQYDQQKKCFEHPYHAFLYSGGTMGDLGTLGGNFSQGNAINLSGEVVGSADLKTGFADAFLWNGKTMVDLGAWSPAGINDFGQISGSCGGHACLYSNGTLTQDADQGFLWSSGKMTDLGLNFFPAAINDNDVIVGGNEIYSGGTLQNLNNLIPAGSSYQIDYANAINDNGQIVADAYDTATNQGHAVLLTPSA